ncbi:MAG: hypothetical protein HRT74_09565, partial [Flavobacteriales bacterium]|nr:hypothetical protein [Flavobacteriales bacterium]
MKYLLCSLLMALVFVVSAQVPDYANLENLILFYDFNNNANDQSQNGFDASLQNNTEYISNADTTALRIIGLNQGTGA